MTVLFDEGLYNFIQTIAPLTALISTRAYPNRAPDAPTRPYLVYNKVSGPRDATHDGDSQLAHPRYQFSFWSPDVKVAKQCAMEFVKAVNGYKGAMGTTARVAAFVDNEIDLFDTESREHHVVVDVIFWNSET